MYHRTDIMVYHIWMHVAVGGEPGAGLWRVQLVHLVHEHTRNFNDEDASRVKGFPGVLSCSFRHYEQRRRLRLRCKA